MAAPIIAPHPHPPILPGTQPHPLAVSTFTHHWMLTYAKVGNNPLAGNFMLLFGAVRKFPLMGFASLEFELQPRTVAYILGAPSDLIMAADGK